MNAPDSARNLFPSPARFEDLVGFELIRRLVAFPTVSRDQASGVLGASRDLLLALEKNLKS